MVKSMEPGASPPGPSPAAPLTSCVTLHGLPPAPCLLLVWERRGAVLPPSYCDGVGYGPRAPGAVPAARVCSWVCSPEQLQGAAFLLECWGGTGQKAESSEEHRLGGPADLATSQLCPLEPPETSSKPFCA